MPNGLDLSTQYPRQQLRQSPMERLSPLLSSQAAPQTASIWDRLLGNLGKGLGGPGVGLLDPEGMKSAGQQGLLAMGASLLQGMKPSEVPRSLLSDLGTALEAGQEAALTGGQQSVEAHQQQRALEYQKKLDIAIQRGATPEQLLDLAQQYGDVGMAQVAIQRLQFEQAEYKERINPATGQYEFVQVGKNNRTVPGTWTGEKTGPREQARLQAEVARGSMTYTSQYNSAKSITKMYDQQVKDLTTAATIIQPGIAELERAIRSGHMSPIAQVLALYTAVKGVDPGSVVRASEIELFRQANNIKGTLALWLQKFDPESGTAIPMTEMENMLRVLNALRDASQRRQSEIYDQKVRMFGPLDQMDADIFLLKPSGYTNAEERDAFNNVKYEEFATTEVDLDKLTKDVGTAKATPGVTPGAGMSGGGLGANPAAIAGLIPSVIDFFNSLESKHGPGSQGGGS